MSIKTKTPTKIDQASQIAQQAGLLLMTAAVTLGMIEMPDRSTRIVLPSQPAFAFAGDNQELNNPIRREREETAPHYMSYTTAQRTQARSGRH